MSAADVTTSAGLVRRATPSDLGLWTVTVGGRRVGLEARVDPAVRADLAARGHEVSTRGLFEAGGAQLVLRTPESLEAASDPRKDRRAVGR